jgi:hypothetical protein
MNTDKFPFKKTFNHTGEDFSATSAAEKWLKEKGLSIGTMCSPDPRGILKGNEYIPKWRYLAHDKLDGMATATDWRHGDVTVYLLSDPE